jgi:hypothetical protein
MDSKELDRKELGKELGRELGKSDYCYFWCSCFHYHQRFCYYQLLEGQLKSSLHLRISRYQQDLSLKFSVKPCFDRSWTNLGSPTKSIFVAMFCYALSCPIDLLFSIPIVVRKDKKLYLLTQSEIYFFY